MLLSADKNQKCVCIYVCMCIYIYIERVTYGASLVTQDSKESACNAGDPGSIPGLGRSIGEGNDNPFQNSMDREPGGLQSIGLQRVRHN